MRRDIIYILTLPIGTLLGATMAMLVPACETPDTEASPDASDDATSILQGPAGSGLGTGLPCDVQAIIENRCIACHDGKQAPPALLQYSDLVAPSTKDPSKTRAVVSVELMKGNAMPPRPAVPPEPDEIASFEDWIKAGTPKETRACTDPPPAGSVPTTTADGGALPPADGGGGICTSGTVWTQGNAGSPLMHPGVACNACHQVLGGPNSRFAGTVYPTLHENNDCNGVAPPPQLNVIITDSRNQVYTLPVNAAGNFVLVKEGGGPPPRAPFKAKVSDGTKTRAMNGSVTSGDCNSCHTTAGLNGAPGRIMAP